MGHSLPIGIQEKMYVFNNFVFIFEIILLKLATFLKIVL